METTRKFDSLGRLERQTLANTGAYTRYEYPANGVQSKTFATINDINDNGADSADEVFSESWADGAGRIRQSRTEHPGSTGGWKGSLAEYDILGRAKRSTVPTEINSSYTPAGDDAARGWLWKHQKYDWKGRVVRTINTDGIDSPTLNASDQIITYEGCGCAGGEVVTIESELVPRDDIPNLNARRKQKTYSDILGRIYKTETMKWDGTTVYSRNQTVFNGRDQAVSIEQQDHTDPSNVASQFTTMTYDGHGRLKTRHRPEQSAGTSTVYNYNIDSSIHSVVDARGATSTNTYDPATGRLTHIQYSVPAGSNIPVTPTVVFSYNNLGLRTSMTDGFGNMQYSYNDLGQMTSETRQFNDSLPNAPLPDNKFKIEYAYSLSGQLKSLKDPYGQQINYGFDKTGRLHSVNSTNPFSGITNYASNADYDARGMLTHLNYGNGVEMNINSFNSRLLPENFEVKKGSTQIIKKNYQYYSDGKLKYAEDVVDTRMDRFNKYDFAGRITEGKSGAEARGGSVTDPQQQELSLPYRQSYGYNAFGELTQRNNLHWGKDFWEGQNFNLNYTYVNNRLMGHSYDADGRLLYSSEDNTYTTYDAAGKIQRVATGLFDYDITRGYDGNGQEIKRNKSNWEVDELHPNGHWVAEPTEYYLRSSVLSNDTLTEIDNTGRKKVTNVNAFGTVMAWQSAYYPAGSGASEWVMFHHQDIYATTYRSTKPDGTIYNGTGYEGSPAEFDPMGGNVGQDNPYYPPPMGEGCIGCQILTAEDSTFIDGKRVTATLDGEKVPYVVAMRLRAIDAALPCPRNNCGGRAVKDKDTGKWRVTLPFGVDPETGKPGFKGFTWGRVDLVHEDGSREEGKWGITGAFWQSGISASEPEPPPLLDKTPCRTMAARAQKIANEIVAAAQKAIGNYARVSPYGGDTLSKFDFNFTTAYIGHIVDGSVASIRALQNGGNWQNPEEPYGQQDFKEEYLDADYTRDSIDFQADQVHHFAAYFSAGINGAAISAYVHKRTDGKPWREFWYDKDDANVGDINLAERAYAIGKLLKKEAGLLKTVGETIKNEICQ